MWRKEPGPETGHTFALPGDQSISQFDIGQSAEAPAPQSLSLRFKALPEDEPTTTSHKEMNFRSPKRCSLTWRLMAEAANDQVFRTQIQEAETLNQLTILFSCKRSRRSRQGVTLAQARGMTGAIVSCNWLLGCQSSMRLVLSACLHKADMNFAERSSSWFEKSVFPPAHFNRSGQTMDQESSVLQLNDPARPTFEAAGFLLPTMPAVHRKLLKASGMSLSFYRRNQNAPTVQGQTDFQGAPAGLWHDPGPMKKLQFSTTNTTCSLTLSSGRIAGISRPVHAFAGPQRKYPIRAKLIFGGGPVPDSTG